jgi:outer membrane protein OmpA-like peptidoglycan-associated protein
MSDSKQSLFSSFGVFAAGLTLAAAAYFLAKPIHQSITTKVDQAHTRSHIGQNTVNTNLKQETTKNPKEVAGHATPVATTNSTVVAPASTVTLETHAIVDSTAINTPPKSTPTAAMKPDTQIFFESGKANLPVNATKLLEPVIVKLKANPSAKAIISGYNDATGNKEKNILLAKERAKSVREALRAAGVAGVNDIRIEMLKPEETMGGTDAEAARRVEITVK